jgi:hypothetical protein
VTNEEKAAMIVERSATGPMLVYCTPDLFEELKKKREDIIVVALGNIPEAVFLRTALDVANEHGFYPLLVSCDMFGMRGIDYRSGKVAM